MTLPLGPGDEEEGEADAITTDIICNGSVMW